MKKGTLGFQFGHFRGDLFGGITAGIVALPLALAFGVQSGLGAAAGLYGAIFISFFASLFGGTDTQISGPTAPMTAVSMVVIAGIIAAFDGNAEKALPTILMVFILAGVIQIVLGIIKVGQYIKYIPYPVVSGFMTGIGVIIIFTQIFPMIGYYPTEDQNYVNEFKPIAEEIILEKILREEAAEDILVLEDFRETIRRAETITEAEIYQEASVLAANKANGVLGFFKLSPRAFQNSVPIDVIFGLLTIFIIYGFKRITKKIPSTLVALLVVSLGAFLFVDDYRTIGTIPSGFPILQSKIFTAIDLGAMLPYLATAVSLALLGAIDSLLTSIVADNKTKTKHRPNKELIGQGIGNSIAGLFGGIPGAGATIRTIVNIDAGGKTRLSGMIAGLFLLLILLSLGPLASMIPAAVLAGILITVGIGVMDYKGLKAIRQIPVSEVMVMILVLLLTVFVGLIEAVAVGMILASILFMKNISDVVDNRTKSAPLKEFSREISWYDEGNFLETYGNKVYVKHLDGPLFFGFASRFQELIKAIPSIKVVAIRMDKVPYVDQSGLYAMEEAIIDLSAQNVKVVFVDIHGQPLDLFKRINLIPDLVDDDYCFENFNDFTEWLKNYLDSNEPNS